MGDAMHDGNKKKRASPGKSLTSKDWVKTGLYTVEGKKNKPWKKPVIGFSLRYKTLPWPDVTPENVLAWQRSERIRLENKINKQFLLTNPKEVDGLIKEVCDSTDPDCVRFYDNSQGYLSSGVMHLVGKQKKKGDPDFMSGREQDGFLFKCRENNLVPCRYEWDAYRKGMKEREASGSSSMNDNLVDLMEGRTITMNIAVLCKSEAAFRKAKDRVCKLAAEVRAEAEAADVERVQSGHGAGAR